MTSNWTFWAKFNRTRFKKIAVFPFHTGAVEFSCFTIALLGYTLENYYTLTWFVNWFVFLSSINKGVRRAKTRRKSPGVATSWGGRRRHRTATDWKLQTTAALAANSWRPASAEGARVKSMLPTRASSTLGFKGLVASPIQALSPHGNPPY